MTSQIQTLNPERLPTPVARYSHVGRWDRIVFIAGQLALDRETATPMSDRTPKEQARIVLEYLQEALQAGGSSIDSVLKTTIYLTDLTDYADVNEVYGQFFANHSFARATVEVNGLVGGLAVEIDAVGVVVST